MFPLSFFAVIFKKMTIYDNALYLGSENNLYFALVEAVNQDITGCQINDKTKIICGRAFEGCTALISITIPGSVTSIGNGAFSDCKSLTSITIPDSVTHIAYGAFSTCTSLKSVTISDGVTSINDSAFRGCTSLRTVYYTGSVEDWNKIVFGSGNDDLLDAEIIFNYQG